MNCPYCGKEMKLGYIQCRDGVTWTLKKQLVSSLSFLGKESTSLENGAADNSSAVYAFKCDDCKKVIIDYSKKGNRSNKY
ncbi:MAG: PF20097 family protein [Clostridia bacterium]|nr:PF20097 family protein [Clostridia bacterium]